jgi:hypothetical protein
VSNQLTNKNPPGQLAVEDVGGEQIVGDVNDAKGEETPVGQ